MKDQEPYTKLKFAFRYRKEYVQGCSCKAADYVAPPGEADKKAENGAFGTAAQRQAAAAQPAPRAPTSPALATGSNAVQSETLPEAQASPSTPSDDAGWQTQAQPQQ